MARLSHPKPFAEGTFYKYHGWCSQVAWELGKASLSMESDWFSDALIDQVAYVHVCIIEVITVPNLHIIVRYFLCAHIYKQCIFACV